MSRFSTLYGSCLNLIYCICLFFFFCSSPLWCGHGVSISKLTSETFTLLSLAEVILDAMRRAFISVTCGIACALASLVVAITRPSTLPLICSENAMTGISTHPSLNNRKTIWLRSLEVAMTSLSAELFHYFR